MAHRRQQAAEKGISALKSYGEQGSSRMTRMAWLPHSKSRQRMRNLRSVCRNILNSKDKETIAALQRAKELVKGKFEEYGMLMIVFQAKDVSDSTGVPFVESLDYILDKIESEKEQTPETTNNPEEVQNG